MDDGAIEEDANNEMTPHGTLEYGGGLWGIGGL